jgi:hypothetical protein
MRYTTGDLQCLMFDVVSVSILKFLKLSEDGFHKFSEGYGIYLVLQYLM